MSVENALSFLGLLGIGGLLSSFLTILWQRKNANKVRHQEYKETRYKCIIILMHAYLNFDKNKSVLLKHGYDIHHTADLADLLKTEHVNAFLYASDEFIQDLGAFIKEPNEHNLYLVARAIRKDMWGLKTSIGVS